MEETGTKKQTPDEGGRLRGLLIGAGLLAFIVLSLATLIILCVLIVPKVHELNDKLADLVSLHERLTRLEAHLKPLELSAESYHRSEKKVTSRVNQILEGGTHSARTDGDDTKVRIPANRSVVVPNEKSKVKYHEVSSGETLYSIGKRYGISVDQMQRLNDLGTKETIYPGQALVVGRAESG